MAFGLGSIWAFPKNEGAGGGISSMTGSSAGDPARRMEGRTIGSQDDGGPWAPTVYTLQLSAQAHTNVHTASLSLSVHAHLVTRVGKK